jgi:hypothetical protein
MIYCTIDEVQYQIANDSVFSIQEAIEARSILELTVLDPDGTADFQRGQPVYFTDSDTGKTYRGFVNASKPVKFGLATLYVGHDVTFFDKQYLLGKRTNSKNYAGEYAGPIAIDFAERLADEGVTVAAATHRDSTAADFNAGILSGLTGVGDSDDGALTLTNAGSDLDIAVDLSSGTPTNVTYAGGFLTPTLTPTLKLSSELIASAGQNTMYVTVWTGTKTLATNNTLSCDMWVPSTNKEISATLDVVFSDAKRMNNLSVGAVYDQNLIPSYTFSSGTLNDLSTYAKDQWYHRTFTFSSAFNGKTVTRVQIGIGGSSPGPFVAYFKNIVLAGTTIFSSTLQTTPVVDHSAGGFATTSTSVTVVQSYDPAATSYASVATSIDTVKLIRSSLVEWIALSPELLSIYASYDNHVYVACTTNSPLPALPAGSNVASTSLYFKALFSTNDDPTVYASLVSLSATLQSAANPTSAKNDVSVYYGTQAAWNTGTHNDTQALSNGDLTLDVYTRDWADHTTTGQTLYALTGASESASSGSYIITTPTTSPTDISWGMSQLNFAGLMVDFTLDIDVKFSSTGAVCQTGVLYRQIGWTNLTNNSFGYYVGVDSTEVQIGYGSNTNTGTDSYTQIATASLSLSANTTIHIKVVVNGSSHKVYINGSSTPALNVIDTTYTTPGNFGLRGYQGPSTSSTTHTFDNLVITPAYTGIWQSLASSISTLGTCGGSAIAWTEIDTENAIASSIIVQTSIDSGSTYQVCTNGGAIPGLTNGVNISGKTVIVQALLNTISQPIAPIVRGLYFRVLGAYPGSLGTRSTIPLGNDNMTRSNTTGSWGTSFDSQGYTKTGTGITNLTSNKALISSTTGYVFMKLGTRTGTDMEGTHRFSLSGSMAEGMVLRYVDVNNYYALSASTTSIDLIKVSGGFSTTLKSITSTLTTSTNYNMRFRVVGSGPVLLYGRVWADLTLEDQTAWDITATG